MYVYMYLDRQLYIYVYKYINVYKYTDAQKHINIQKNICMPKKLTNKHRNIIIDNQKQRQLQILRVQTTRFQTNV